MKQKIKKKIKKFLDHQRILKSDELRDWIDRRYAAPSPNFVKHQVILRNGIANATWVETGTYKGDTSAILSEHSQKVYTIEPADQLYLAAKSRFENASNVEVIHGLSETVFPALIPKLSGDVNFWLDGHYSTGVTYQGPKDSPVVEELAIIEKYLKNFNRVVILIDDIRYCANPAVHQFSGYPKLDLFVAWASKNDLYWHIEHDTFVIKNKELYTAADV